MPRDSVDRHVREAQAPSSSEHAVPLIMPTPGIVIFEAEDIGAAQQIMEGDPTVRAGVFMARLNSFKLFFGRPRVLSSDSGA